MADKKKKRIDLVNSELARGRVFVPGGSPVAPDVRRFDPGLAAGAYQAKPGRILELERELFIAHEQIAELTRERDQWKALSDTHLRVNANLLSERGESAVASAPEAGPRIRVQGEEE
jgi:hypothetical protein